MRNLKISKFIIASRNSTPMKIIPSIKLQGDWLQDYGFEPGMGIQITNPEPGTITIKIL